MITSSLFHESKLIDEKWNKNVEQSFLKRMIQHLPKALKPCNIELICLYKLNGSNLDDSKYKFDIKILGDPIKYIETAYYHESVPPIII